MRAHLINVVAMVDRIFQFREDFADRGHSGTVTVLTGKGNSGDIFCITTNKVVIRDITKALAVEMTILSNQVRVSF